MDLTPLIPAGRQIIESYAAGTFRVSGRRLEGPILIFPDRVLAWQPADPTALAIADFAAIGAAAAQGEIELLLLGTGKAGLRLAPEWRRACRDLGFGIEAMATGAACRTYNVLMAEGRRVAAALLPLT